MTRFGIETLQTRLQAAVDEEGLRPFSRRASIGVGVVRSVLDGRDPSFANAKTLADALSLDFGFGPATEAQQSSAVTIDGMDFAHVPLHGATLAAGNGAMNDSEAIIDHLAFRRSWLAKIGISVSCARLARAAGESMAPTIHPGDMLLIDTSKNAPPDKIRSPKDTRLAPIYALLDDGAARVKRLALVENGHLALYSDNPSTPPDFRPLSDVNIIGRVMWWGHTNRD